jgi:hypothetical protein
MVLARPKGVPYRRPIDPVETPFRASHVDLAAVESFRLEYLCF